LVVNDDIVLYAVEMVNWLQDVRQHPHLGCAVVVCLARDAVLTGPVTLPRCFNTPWINVIPAIKTLGEHWAAQQLLSRVYEVLDVFPSSFGPGIGRVAIASHVSGAC
jgi:hypothetical protein